jgi:hypothetical protein
MRASRFAIIVLFLVSLPALNAAGFAGDQAVPDSTIEALNSVWTGTWINNIGHVYYAEMHLTVLKDGTIEGRIDWTLEKSPRESEQSNLGMKGVEYVKGKYDAESRVLSFYGYSKDDPNTILGLDTYRLLLAENELVIGGITENHGDWLGIFNLTRTK